MPETAKRVITRVLSGELDGSLVDLSSAIAQRITSGDVSVKWRFCLDGLDITEDDLTFEEAFQWERAADQNWSMLRPLADASVCRSLLLVLLQSRKAMSPEEAEEQLKRWTLGQVVAAFSTFEEVAPDPLDPSEDFGAP